jgi:hypothetical protein
MKKLGWVGVILLVLILTQSAHSQSASETLIDDWERIPLIDYTYWCVPTSQAMVLAFYDNYVQHADVVVGYGRLIDHWLDHSEGSNAPSLIDVIIDPATGTWRRKPDGTPWETAEEWMLDNFRYDFSFPAVTCNAANDYCWLEIKAEIDSGRPLMWSPPGHCVAAFGYGVRANGERYVVTYDPPNHNVPTSRAEYAYDSCEGIRKIIPGSRGGQTTADLALFSPDGGESLPQWIPYKITWHVWESTVKSVDLDYSIDGGNTWHPIAIGIAATTGLNSRYWAPPVSTNRGRIRVKGYSQDRTEYIAGDGSQTNFTVTAGLSSATNWCFCSWQTVGPLKTHNDMGNWCPPGSFLTQLDLDSDRTLSAGDSPVVGRVKCCQLCGFQASRWGSCSWHQVEYDKTHFQIGNWCPLGTFLVQLDLGRDATHGDANSPIVARAKCCSLPGMEFAQWGTSYWMEVGILMSHNDIGDWCLPGTFLTQLDWDSVPLSNHDSPVVARCRCCEIDTDSTP